jgi:cell division protein FtsW (lipid II flippase)/cell division protein FtsI/penicillin-binding protein 2
MSSLLEARGRTTRSTASQRRRFRAWQTAFERDHLLPFALALAIAVLAWLLILPARTAGLGDTMAAVRRGEIVNLNAVPDVKPVDRVLRGVLPDAPERAFVAAEVFRRLPAGGARRPLENVGALAAIRVPAADVAGRRALPGLAARAEAALAAAAARPDGRRRGPVTVPLLAPEQFQALKASFVVRDPARFTGAFLMHALLVLGAFAFMHVGLHATGRTGDRWLLPVAVALSGIGFAMLVSLRDPLRDQMLFTRFAEGTLFGGIALLLCALPAYERTVLRRLAFVPLLAALGLSLALVALGRGPSGSDAKVNLFGTQPMELIRVLLVLFLAGYFAPRWALLRELDEPPLGDAWYLRILRIPRLRHVVPVAVGVVASLVLFFVQRDLGPALLLIALFLSLYAVTRREVGLAIAGLGTVLAAFLFSHLIGFPRTVSLRTAMWLDPWENGRANGDQIAHGLWAFASGGLSGTGLGLGAPALVPAAHTDLIFSAVAEELGFVGMLACAALFALLIARGFRIARRAPEAYTMYLALGLTLGLALQTLLIAGGVAGLAPLSGVVTPFLSYGRSAQIVHFATIGILWSLAASGAAAAGAPEPAGRSATAGLRSAGTPPARPLTALDLAFARPRGVLLAVLAVLGGAVLLKFAWVQVVRADATFARGSLALQADGEHRFQYNPRLRLVAAAIPRGNVLDRNGVLLASSRWKDVTDRRATLARFGVDVDQVGLASDERHYPFGGLTFHVLGDLVTRTNWGATNTAFLERSHDAYLSGYDDHARAVTIRDPLTHEPRRVVRRDMRELVPLWRHRQEPRHPQVREMMQRERDLKLTIDIRLQQRTAALLRERLDAAGLERGAAVVLDPDTGELLAIASAPAPRGPLRGEAAARLATLRGQAPIQLAAAGDREPGMDAATGPLLDRARFGLYPPGSTFKLVTAAAALSRGGGLAESRYGCRPLTGGRVGAVIDGRPVRDDAGDPPHGTVGMEEAMVVSCNAYYAQLGRALGWPSLSAAGERFGITMGDPRGAAAQRAHAVESAYGQAQVVATPLAMARVAGAMAAGGQLPAPHLVLDPAPAVAESMAVSARTAAAITRMMRAVVERGTAQRIAAVQPAIAGKTGTAEVASRRSHAWFIGYAPYGVTAGTATAATAGAPARRRIAFAILIENGGYGGGHATELAARIVAEARRLGII